MNKAAVPLDELPTGSTWMDHLDTLDALRRSSVGTLKKLRQLDNTIIIFTGDNGLSLGDHGLMGKSLEQLNVIRRKRAGLLAGSGNHADNRSATDQGRERNATKAARTSQFPAQLVFGFGVGKLHCRSVANRFNLGNLADRSRE